MEMKVSIKRNGKLVTEGHQSDIRELIEDMLEEEIGIRPMLQEETDNEVYEIYVHSESYSDLTEDEINKLEKLKINEDIEQTTESICELLNIECEITDEWL